MQQKKTIENGSRYVCSPPYDTAPFLIIGWVGQLKTKCCKQTYKQTDLYRKLREDISPIFKPTKKMKNSNARMSSF